MSVINERTMQKAISVVIRNGCVERDWTMKEFCERAEVTRPNFYMYLSGERNFPFPVLVRVALVFGLKPSQLLQQAEEYERGYWA